MKHVIPPTFLVLALLVAPVLAACGGGGGSASSEIAQKTEADLLVGTYLGVAFTILRDDNTAQSERDVASYTGGLALRADGTYVRTIVVDGVETTDIGTWEARFSVLRFTPADGGCAYDATYRMQNGVLIVDALHPCDEPIRVTRHWLKD